MSWDAHLSKLETIRQTTGIVAAVAPSDLA